MATAVSTPPISRASSSSSGTKRRHSDLSLDFSDLPPLSQPTPPSNTLLITNLNDPLIFTAPNLASIRDAISAQTPLHSFSPLRSFRRIIATFPTIEAATAIRNLLDGETVLGHRIRVYFGEPTVLEPTDQHLHAPQSQKLFFISPPPSPPHGWTMRNEEPPNKAVHADDLASALANLHARNSQDFVVGIGGQQVRTSKGVGGHKRSRSSTVVFDPVDMGHSPDLPAIAVEDTGDEYEVEPKQQSVEGGETKAFVHTARPPVELME